MRRGRDPGGCGTDEERLAGGGRLPVGARRRVAGDATSRAVGAGAQDGGGVGRNASSSSHSIGKVATTFLLVDETVPNASVAVESAKLRDVLVRTRFASSDGRLHDAGQGQLATAIRYVRHLTSSHGLEEKAIYPGDRLWVHGPLKDRGGYLGFGRRAWLDDRAPDDRVAWHTNFAAFGGVVVVLAALVVLVGQVW